MAPPAVGARFAAALEDPALPVPAGLTSARGAPDRLRFAVYRNNVHVSLVEALERTFPVTLRLVGRDFFRAMARAYAAKHKPDSPVMIRYGASFADFVAAFPPAAGLTYLPDLARLEHAWLEAYHAAEDRQLDAGELARLAADRLAGARLVAHPATRLVGSAYAIGSIWSAHQAGEVTPVETGRAETVLLTRPRAQVRATVLPPLDVSFVRLLLSGASIAEAAANAAGRVSVFHVWRILSGLVGLGAFAAVQTSVGEITG